MSWKVKKFYIFLWLCKYPYRNTSVWDRAAGHTRCCTRHWPWNCLAATSQWCWSECSPQSSCGARAATHSPPSTPSPRWWSPPHCSPHTGTDRGPPPGCWSELGCLLLWWRGHLVVVCHLSEIKTFSFSEHHLNRSHFKLKFVTYRSSLKTYIF